MFEMSDLPKPIPTVGVLIIKDNKVLLVKHLKKAENITNIYGLPAGRMEKNETEKESALRELEEETGLKTTAKELAPLPTTYRAVIKRKEGNVDMTYKIFMCKSFSGKLINSEGNQPEWIEISNLPNISLLPNVESAIKEGLDTTNSSEKYLQLFDALTNSIEAFLQEVKKHKLQDMATMEWSVKDVLCHIAFWHNYYAQNYASLAAGTKPYVFPSQGGSTRNQDGVDTLKHKPQKELVTIIKKAQNSLYKSIVIKGVSKMCYTGKSEYKTDDFLEMIAAHIKRHAVQVRKAK